MVVDLQLVTADSSGGGPPTEAKEEESEENKGHSQIARVHTEPAGYGGISTGLQKGCPAPGPRNPLRGEDNPAPHLRYRFAGLSQLFGVRPLLHVIRLWSAVVVSDLGRSLLLH